MHLEELDLPLSRLRGIGPASMASLGAAGIRTVRDLLWHLPRDWQDRSVKVSLASARGERRPGEGDEPAAVWICTEATVTGHEYFGHGREPTLKILVSDGSAEASLVCFNRPFLARQLPVGSRLALCGLAQYRFREIQLSSFEFEKRGAAGDPGAGPSDFDRILPLYPLTGKLGQGFFRKSLELAMEHYGSKVGEFLPPSILEREGFPSRAGAFAALHQPPSQAALAAGRRRLVYDELFLLQLQVVQRAAERRRLAAPGEALPAPAEAAPAAASQEGSDWPPLAARLAANLPFALTRAQVKAVDEILADLGRPWSMARLIQGDVGSGKTLVALLAALAVIGQGAQVALMVPTVLLARQHAEKAQALLAPLGVQVALFAGPLAAAARRGLLEAIAGGGVQLVVGTHGLFGADIRYRRLELAIIDEQHRFGVLQRQALHQKASRPNLLMMSATPIPQTIALTVFGDMELSTIRELPAGRKPIETHLARMGNEAKVYEWVRRELAEGRQAYFVYPLIDESGDAEPEDREAAGEAGEAQANRELKNAESMYRRLAGEIFPEYPAGMIHSRMPEESKESVMEQFAAGQLRILVATSVVEVGVDVPNASCMVIEHAERFGLSALHQLRGRVGRGGYASYCFLVYQEPLSGESKRRLRVLKESNDGFLIAEEDLAIRGPGDIRGTAQSGFMRLRAAELPRDLPVMHQARADALAVVGADPRLEAPANAGLRRVLELLRKTEIERETASQPAD